MSIGVMLGTAEKVGGGVVFCSQSVSSESLTTAGVASTLAGKRGQVWRIVARAAVFVEFGAAPDGAGSTRWEMPSGDVLELAVTQDGEKVAFATV